MKELNDVLHGLALILKRHGYTVIPPDHYQTGQAFIDYVRQQPKIAEDSMMTRVLRMLLVRRAKERPLDDVLSDVESGAFAPYRNVGNKTILRSQELARGFAAQARPSR